MVSFESPYRPFQPSFQDVLDNIAPEPYTLSAFKHFLKQRHAIESLQFLLCFRHYATLYSLAAPEPESATEHPQREALSTLWQNLVSLYILPESRNEINITTQQRHALLAHYPTPQPWVLEQTVQQIAEALRTSVFAEFVNSVDMQSRKYRVHTRTASMPVVPTLAYLASTSPDSDAAVQVKRNIYILKQAYDTWKGQVNVLLAEYIQKLDAVKIRGALSTVLSISQQGNIFLQSNGLNNKLAEQEPLKCAGVIGLAINLIHLLSSLIAPFMSDTAESINTQLCTKPILIPDHWDADSVKPCHEIGQAEYLFSKIKPEKGAEWQRVFGAGGG